MSTSVPTRSRLPRWLTSPPPSAAVEIAARRVTAVAMADRGGAHVLTGYASVELPERTLEPALNAPNVHDAQALSGAIRAAIEKLSPRPRRVALVVPDTVAKVSLLRFEKVPPRAQDLEQLVRWQMRKSAPFRIEDAQVAFVPSLVMPDGGREFLVSLARRDIVESYEKACAAAGAYAGLVDLASFNVINLVMAAQPAVPGDWLLVHVAADYATLAVVRDGHVIFFRNRATSEEEDLAELVHQTAMYHEDRLGGGGFGRIVLAGASARGAERAERLRRHVEERIGMRAEPVALGDAAVLRDRIQAAQELVDTVAPAVGILVRERGPQRGVERVA